MGWGKDPRKSFGGGGGGAVGSGLGYAVAGPVGGALGGAGGYQWGSGAQNGDQIGDKMGWGPNAKQHDAERAARDAMGKSYGAGVSANKDIMDHEEAFYNRQTGRDDTMLGRSAIYKDQLQGEIETLKNEADTQAKDARSTYTNNILPQYKTMMERSAQEGKGAMTLADAGNVNNKVHTDVRNLYEKQAQGVGKQGLADAGVLAALGAQATAGQMGGAPMTGGQMAALQGQNQAQSGAAYSRAQGQMQSLREQGLNRGFEESDRQYQRGQGALDRWERNTGNYEGANNRMNQEQRDFRGERGGLAQGIHGLQQGQNNLEYGVRTGTDQMGLQMDTAQANRTLANEQGYYGGLAGQAAAAGANQAGKISAMANLFGTGASAAAGYAGSPGGAAALAGAGGGGGGGAAANPYGGQQANYGANTNAAPLPGLGGGDPSMAPGYTGNYGQNQYPGANYAQTGSYPPPYRG